MSKYNGKFNGIFLDKDHLHMEFTAFNKDFHALLDRCYDLWQGVQLDGTQLKFKFDVEVIDK